MTPDSGETSPSQTGRTKKRRTNSPAIDTATATANTATNQIVGAPEAAFRVEHAGAERRRRCGSR